MIIVAAAAFDHASHRRAARNQFCKTDIRYSSGLSIHNCNEAHGQAEARPPKWTGAGKRPSAMRRYIVDRLSAVMRITSRKR